MKIILPTKMSIRVRWTWNYDVYEDMMSGVLLGFLGHYSPGHLFNPRLIKSNKETLYLYIGLLIFYVRIVVETNRPPDEYFFGGQ